jgi:D-threo-aldose 1-dehydrogenase
MALKTRHWDRIGNGGVTFTQLGFGTAPLGNLYRAISEDAAQATLQAAWDSGIRTFDTAPLYGFGLSETRLNHFLRGRKRSDYVISTKIGRILKPAKPGKGGGAGKWFEVPSRTEVFDYTYDGAWRSLEASLERLGVDYVDILLAHDLDVFTHKSQEALEPLRNTFLTGGYKALMEMRQQGLIKAFGAGVNEWQTCQWLLERGDFDIFLLAGRYTLLEQTALDSFLPLCVRRGVGILVGGPYNSGILATGPKPGAYYNYDPAPPEILEKVAMIERFCQSYGVRLVDAAFQFCLRHLSVVSVIPGGQSKAEADSNFKAATAEIPAGLWTDLKAAGLLRADAPV